MKGPILLKTATFSEKDSSLGKKKFINGMFIQSFKKIYKKYYIQKKL